MYYEVEGTNTRILGSVHLFPKGVVDLPPRVEAAMSWAEQICFEHNVVELLPLMAAPTPVLHATLPPAMFAALASIWPHNEHIPELARMKPWSALMVSASSGLDGEPGLDVRMNARLSQAGRSFNVIESAQEVSDLFDGPPVEHFIAAMEQMLESRPDVPRKFQALYEAWFAGDEAGIWEVAKDGPMIEDPVLYEAIFVERNRRWASRMEQFFFQSNAKILLIVGCLHLQGPENLLELIRASGRRVSKLEDVGVRH
ncbi:TraB/GumN family protein [Variovorax arabinosiphilus]|uniref:TraB/GumN family protein n=1 Tax=Variovorax arabinosiphilus TaxID=3053498 RepID=UPI0025776931|nr:MULTISPECIES: TraB/GumN family protein [unclassified Variovorax]MDM0118916.1 TraB/GumN family protein [Variovorax sp. J2L1-78]MDM0129342.1 TraB/GumN family protein [Variovorax sp. J2L1-63]MDM0232872.1 TraB/GumN family protein [Variovorax sp. J2R1-6]